MPKDILITAMTLVSVPVVAWLSSVMTKRKYDTEIAKLKTEVDKMHTEVHSNELDNVRAGNDILMSQIVEPLRNEIKYLRRDVNNFRRAIEKVNSCAMSADCPVRNELHAAEKDDADQAAGS